MGMMYVCVGMNLAQDGWKPGVPVRKRSWRISNVDNRKLAEYIVPARYFNVQIVISFHPQTVHSIPLPLLGSPEVEVYDSEYGVCLKQTFPVPLNLEPDTE